MSSVRAPSSGRRLLLAIEEARSAVRREDGREVPLGPKAARTRAALLAAAHDVLCRQGYQHTAVSDIAEAAGVSLGTFYQYFRDRPDVMVALVGDTIEGALSSSRGTWRADHGREGVVRSIVDFVAFYAGTAAFQAVWEEVTHVDDRLASLRRDLSRVYVEATAAELASAQARGLVRPEIDPAATAVALSAMVDRHCYLTYVFDPPDPLPNPERTADLLADLWVEAVGLVQPEGQM